MKSLSEDEAYILQSLRENKPSTTSNSSSYTGGSASSTKTRSSDGIGSKKLKEQVTMDSDGFPNILNTGSSSSILKTCSRQLKEQVSMDSDGFPSILKVKNATGPPVSKEDWKSEVFKKPAAPKASLLKVKGKFGKWQPKSVPAKSSMQDAMSEDVVLKNLYKTIATKQSYIQRTFEGKKRLVVAISEKQASQTNLSHKDLIEKLWAYAQKDKTKGQVLAHRDKLLSVHATK